jgi:uncharacterized membrane protein
MRRHLLQNPVVAFTSLALVFGLTFCLLTPPFFVLDESVHFSHAYALSTGQLRAQKLNANYYGSYLPQKVNDSVLASLGFRTNQPDMRTTYADNFTDRAPATDTNIKTEAIFNSTAIYPPVPYVPQAAGILVGRILHLQTVYLLYLGRIFNLLAWVGIVAVAIWLMPYGRWALAVVALLPTSVFEAASLSADGVTTALAFLAAALVLRLGTQKNLLSRRQYWLLGGLMVLLALTKQSYFCFVLLVLALPLAKFRSRSDYWKKTGGIIALSLVPTLAWTWSVRKIDIFLPILPNHPPIQKGAQLHNMITQPYHFGLALWNSLLTGRADTTVSTFVGQFGRVYDLHLPMLVVVLAYVLVIMALFNDETVSAVRDRRRLKQAVAGVLVLSFLAITGTLYLTWNILNNNFVDGIQARYFLPLMVLLIPLVKLRKSNLVRLQVKPSLLLAGSTGLLLISAAMMAHRFYYAFS